MARRKGPYSREFKDEAVRMVLDGNRPVAHIARELGVHDTTLHNWVAAWRREHGDSVPGASSAESKKSDREAELEREVRKLREENAFLKKAAAFFAAENR